ncbi:hypothetical protein [Mangrovivirga cuniculi]|uniref:HTTM domain-containing protein n=1 Tax=Mangrovivirga cuniculi TaxID=2715131 RepID=A0A4D7JSH7_9BACT|nr:hypothetical protein [Mangrovivirga cuniculi]QCK13895.1 hypothetical protein DCC35_03520 [Mangrovivirga cuniculi]
MSIRKSIETEKLKVFSVMWAITVLSHLITFDDWIEVPFYLGYTLAVFCIALLLRPGSMVIFILAVINSLALSFQKMPFIPNHMMYEWLINIPLLLYLIIALIKEKRNSVGADRLFIWVFEPVAQWGLLILYFFVVFHKLNFGFFDVDHSCGVFLFEGIIHRMNQIFQILNLPSIALNTPLKYVSIYSTIIIEAIIPLFLFTRRFRTTGIFIGLIFHYLLSLHAHLGIFSFSLMMYTYYVFFLPETFFTWIRNFRVKSITIYLRIILSALVIGFFLVYKYYGYWVYYLTGQTLWYIIGLAYIVIYLIFLRSINRIYESELFRVGFPGYAGLVFLLFITLNGFSPYLGLKTETSYAMFSNLKTENGSNNHILMPEWLQLFDFQKDLVEITDSNVKYVKSDYYHEGQPRLFTNFEVQRIIRNLNPGEKVSFKSGDDLYTIENEDGVINKSEGVKNYSYFTYKFLLFRPVYPGDVSFCQH